MILLTLVGLVFAAFFGASVASVTSDAVGLFAFALSAASMFVSAPRLALFTLMNPSSITWNGKEVMSMTETIFETMYANPTLTTFHNIVEGIVAKQQIVFLGTLSKISKADAGCNTSASTKSISSTEKFWEPAKVKFWLEQCADDLEEMFWVWGFAKGIDRKDLTMDDFGEFVTMRIQEALTEDVMRIAWFNDPDHTAVHSSPDGLLSVGTSATDYNIIDGLWSQIYVIVAADSSRRYTISENTLGTVTLQDALATDRAVVMLRSMYQNADKRLKHDPKKFFILTDSLVDNYQTWLETQSVDSSFTRVQAGERGQFDTGLRFRGIPIFCFDFWDRTIRADFYNGTTHYQPHRAVLTVKENIPIGVDGVSAMTSMSQFYLPKEETSNWKGAYKIDAKVLLPYMIQVAY